MNHPLPKTTSLVIPHQAEEKVAEHVLHPKDTCSVLILQTADQDCCSIGHDLAMIDGRCATFQCKAALIL